MTRMVRSAPHKCDLPWPRDGEIRRCDCGKYFIGRVFPNHDYDRWSQLTWIGRKLRGLS